MLQFTFEILMTIVLYIIIFGLIFVIDISDQTTSMKDRVFKPLGKSDKDSKLPTKK